MKVQVLFLVVLSVVLAVTSHCSGEHKATVTVTGKNVLGTIVFTQKLGIVELEGEVSGLTPGKHGFHVHVFGDVSNGCASTGGHFNPQNHTHGAPEDGIRHVGDLGNIEAGANGVAKVHIRDSVISLEGENDIIGRAVVVHEGVDDLGKGGESDSLTTGHAGGRVACGIIGRL